MISVAQLYGFNVWCHFLVLRCWKRMMQANFTLKVWIVFAEYSINYRSIWVYSSFCFSIDLLAACTTALGLPLDILIIWTWCHQLSKWVDIRLNSGCCWLFQRLKILALTAVHRSAYLQVSLIIVSTLDMRSCKTRYCALYAFAAHVVYNCRVGIVITKGYLNGKYYFPRF